MRNLAWSLPFMLMLVACEDAITEPRPVSALPSSESWLLSERQEFRMSPEGRKLRRSSVAEFSSMLKLPTERKESGVAGVRYAETRDRFEFRVYFNEDIGWEKAIELCELPGQDLSPRPEAPESVDGLATKRTRVGGIKPPFMYYVSYHRAQTTNEETPSRFWLEIDLQ